MANNGGGGSSSSSGNRKEIAMRLRAAAEEAVQCIGLGYDLTLDLRLKYCKKQQRLIAIDDGQARDIAIPGGILVQNVPKSINCDKGERVRFSSDVLSFQQVVMIYDLGIERLFDLCLKIARLCFFEEGDLMVCV